MANEFEIKLAWSRTSEFTYDQFSRDHKISFSGNQSINNSAAAEYLGNANMTNPEELLAASLASCHMLTFLAIASKSGFIVEQYRDSAVAILGKNEAGFLCVTDINLHPEITFSGEKIPDTEKIKSLHDKAHRNCFIANSIATKVHVQ